MFSCVSETRTKDCGLAEQRVFAELRNLRRGKPGQEYFQVTLEYALEVIQRVCRAVDVEVAEIVDVRIRPDAGLPTNTTQDVYETNTFAPPRNAVVQTMPAQAPNSTVKHPAIGQSKTFWLAVAFVWLCVYVIFRGGDDRAHVSVSERGATTTSSFSDSKTRTPKTTSVSEDAAVLQQVPGQLSATSVQQVAPASNFEQNDGSERVSSRREQGTVLATQSAGEFSQDKVGAGSEMNASNADTVAPTTTTSARSRSDDSLFSLITRDEKQSLEITCSFAKFHGGPAGYNDCLRAQLAKFDPARRPAGLDALTREEKQSLEITCSSAKFHGGPAGYNECLSAQLAKFDPARRPVGLDGLTREEKQSLEITCSSAKFHGGPAGYNECLTTQLAKFDPARRPVGLDGLTREEKQSLEITCSSAKFHGGPAGYNECLSTQLAKFDPARRPVGLDGLTREEKQSLEITCSSAKFHGGPAGYNECLSIHLAKFDPAQRPR
jgi:hypothetical protein